jgi:diguanylate cyclase (GGDEF)-like protein/PAS domain S-box-containing protein
LTPRALLMSSADAETENVGTGPRPSDKQETDMLGVDNVLRTLEPTLRFLADAVMVTTADCDPPGPRIVLVNDAFTNLTGYSSEDVIGKSPRILRGLETGCEALYRFPGDLEGRCHAIGRATHCRKDGSEYLVDWQVIPLLDKNGSVRHWLSIQRDVTRWQVAENGYLTAEQSYRQLVENQPDPICRFLPDTTLTFVNRAYADLFRCEPEELVNKRLSEVLPEEDALAVIAHLVSVTPDRPSAQYEHKNVRKSGKVSWQLWNTLAFFENDGNIVSYQSVGTDITLRKEAEVEILREKERAENYLAIAANMFVALDVEGRISLVNKRTCEVLGRRQEELMGESWFETAIPVDQRRHACAEFGRVMRGKIGAQKYCESDVLTRSGHRRLIAWQKTALKNTVGRITGTLSCGEDITERKQDEEMLRKLSSAVEQSPSSIIITDAHGTIEYVNPTFTETSGYTPQEAIGQNPRILKSGLVPDGVYLDLWQSISAGKNWRGELCNKTRAGAIYWDLVAIAPVRDARGNITHFVSTQHDITEQKLLVRQMAHDATHDALTDLVNRREFERRLERAIVAAKEHGSHHVLCYLDLDQFKLVNDTAGHAAGDELLKQVRGLLKGKFRGRDTLARLGGDEFGLLLDNCSLERANKISEMVVTNLRDYQFFWEGRSFRVGVSIGLVAITAETESIAQAMTQADVACYAAKERGRNRVRVYHAEGEGTARHHSEIRRATALRNAVEEDRFCLYCQPIVPLSGTSDALVRYEILVRLIDVDGQLVLPRAFIPAAERYGLMGAIDRWVIRHAFRYCASTFDKGSRVEFAINLSGDSLNDDSFPDFVRRQFSLSRIPAERICFEITETAAIQNVDHVTQVINGIRKKGSRFALDDFGIGLSSFDYLKTLPVDYVKIDGRFVQDMVENAVDQAMVSAINEVGHVMGIETIAEFAHNEAILERLAALGVDYAQGYAIGAPIPLSSIVNEPRPIRH